MDIQKAEASDMVQEAKRLYGKAERAKEELKRIGSVLIGGLEAFAAPLLWGGIEGRFARDGSGHITVLGIPVNGGLGALFLVGGASGLLDEVGPHIADAGKGLAGGFGQDVGRQLGLAMRLKAGLPVVEGLLPPAKVTEIKAHLSPESQKRLADAEYQRKAAVPDRGIRVGGAPQPWGPEVLTDLVEQAIRARQAA